MVNLSDVDPDDISTAPTAGQAQADSGEVPTNLSQVDPSQIQTEDEYNQSQYGGTGQQIMAGIEGVAQGVAGPLAPLAERALGVDPAAIRGRAAANPWTHGIAAGAGLAGSALIPGLGEASLAGAVGNIGEHAAGLLPEATGLLSKIAATGVKTGAEMAALQTSDELSKLVTEDPNQSLQSAAVNIGLSGVLGGAVIGSVSPLWNKAINKIGVEKLASDYMGETEFLRTNPDPVSGAQTEVNDRIASTNQIMRGGLKGELVDKLTQEVSPELAQSHVSDVSQSIETAPSALKNEPIFQQAVESWKKSVTPEVDPITLETTSAPTSGQIFRATENLKRTLQGFAEPLYNGSDIPVRDMPFIKSSASLATGLKESLEDSKIWGPAADVQKQYNAAISPLFDIQKEFLVKFASKELGEKVADPTKINTYLNQAEKSKAGLKTNYVKNYLDQTQKAADAINSAYLENEVEAPFESKLNPTPVLDHSLNTPPSAGVDLARWTHRTGAATMAANATGHIGGELVGGGLGFLVGHPLAGAWMGDKILKPVFSALAKPLAETAINSGAAKGAVDYVGNIVRGQRLISDAVGNFFKFGSEVIGKDLIPDQASRDKLEKSLEYASDPQNAMSVGGNLGHYLPQHATAAASTAAIAQNYFQSIKPKQPAGAPFDEPAPIDSHAQYAYNRQLDIAQQPLLALQHAKDGTILPQDIATIKTIYPALHAQLASKIGQEMIEAKTNGVTVPYKTKLGLSQLIGYPMDSTMTPQSAQAIIASSGSAQSQTQQSTGNPKKATGVALKQINKSNDLTATNLQARQIEKRE
jgi:hypothetical protein